MRARTARPLHALVGLVLLAAPLVPGPSAAVAEDRPAARGWDYTVRVAPDLQRMRVEMCFRGFVPKLLHTTRVPALAAIAVRPHPDGRPAFAANPRRDGIRPAHLRDGGCLRYDVDVVTLRRLGRGSDRETQRIGRDLVTRTGLVLLRPAVWPDDVRVTVRLVLPDGMRAAVPWSRDPSDPGRYVIDRGALLPYARLVIGRFTPTEIAVPGGTLVASTLDAPHRATPAGVRRWLEVAASAVADLFGTFPQPRTQVIVQPLVPGRGRPVVFGRAMLGGGPLVHVMLSGTTTDAAMPGEWLTIHEMIHLGMPWTADPDRWFGEGVVSYYQEVLRARAGFVTEREAWSRLHTWFERGKGSGGARTLAEESRLMTNRYAYHRVYWGGAALTLLMDLAIRKATKGARTFDDAVRHLHRTCLIANRTWTGLELLQVVDEWLGQPVCVPIARRALASRRFPDLTPAYRALGLGVRGGRLVYVPGGAQEAARSAIMRAGGR